MLVTAGIVAAILLLGGGFGGWFFLRRRPATAGLQNIPGAWRRLGAGRSGVGGPAQPLALAGAAAGSNNLHMLPTSAQPALYPNNPLDAPLPMPQQSFPMPASIPPQPIPMPTMPMPTENYRPGALQPITTSIPVQIVRPQPEPAAHHLPTSDMRPLPMDALDFSQVLIQHPEPEQGWQPIAGDPSDLLPVLPLSPAASERAQKFSFASAPLPAVPAPLPTFSAPLPAVPAPLPAVPGDEPIEAPSIKDDPMLEAIMRQAQMGLYALPDKSSKERSGNTASLRTVQMPESTDTPHNG